jgi:hypothetical protein
MSKHFSLVFFLIASFANIQYVQAQITPEEQEKYEQKKREFSSAFHQNSRSQDTTSSCRNLKPGQELRLDSVGGSVEFIPEINQGSTNMCFAAVSTLLYDAYRMSKNPMQSLLTSSVLASATLYAELSLKHDINMSALLDHGNLGPSNTEKTILFLLHYGGCPINNYFDNTFANDQQSISDALEELHSIADQSGVKVADKLKNIEIWSQARLSKIAQDKIINNLGNREKLITALARPNNRLALHSTFRAILCPKSERLRVSGPNPPTMSMINRTYLSGNQNRFLQNVKDSISKTMKNSASLPHALTTRVCNVESDSANLFQFQAFDSIGRANPIPHDDQCFDHGFVIVGLRKSFQDSAKSCQYLIRNSWGKHCQESNYRLAECDEERGQFWIDEDRILKSTNGHIYL